MRIMAVLMFAAGFLTLWSCSGPGAVHPGKIHSATAGHPPLAEQEMLIACDQCHQEATPEVFRAWFDSGHGIGKVKCYQCHGTFEDLRSVPAETACAVCHAAEYEHRPAGSSCWQCHPAHSFNVHGK